jgi:hypothetical protein
LKPGDFKLWVNWIGFNVYSPHQVFGGDGAQPADLHRARAENKLTRAAVEHLQELGDAVHRVVAVHVDPFEKYNSETRFFSHFIALWVPESPNQALSSYG